MAQKPEDLRKKVANIQQELNNAGYKVDVDGEYGPQTKAAPQRFLAPLMRKAVVSAEGNYKNYGVKSQESKDPNENYRTMSRSVDNNIDRFMTGVQSNDNYDNSGTPRFIDFMQQRWAPIGAENDPNNLNPNWAPNVRKSLQRQLSPAEYERLRRMRLAQLQPQMAVA